MRISDWSSDVCSSDLVYPALAPLAAYHLPSRKREGPGVSTERSEATILTTTLLFAATWLASEYLRATLFTGFAWNPLGVTLLPTGMAIASTLIGTYGLGALAILASGAILLTLRRQFRPAAALTAPLVALALWGNLSPAPPTPPGAPRIRGVQPNIGQDEKYSPERDRKSTRLNSSTKSASLMPSSAWK